MSDQMKKNRFISYWKEKFPLLFRFKGSVLVKIWPQVVLGVFNSVFVICIHKFIVEFPEFPPSFITVLGLVIGLLLVFRTSTGYDRYYEGRKLWSTVTYRVRMMSYSVWLGIKECPETRTKDYIEKRSAINLLLAFAFATKNYLREDYSYDADEDIKQLIRHLNRITQNREESKMTDVKDDSPGHSRMFTVRIKLPIDKETRRKNFKEHVTMSARRRLAAEKKNVSTPTSTPRDASFQAHDYFTPTNIPLELVCHFLSYVYKVTDEKKIDAETGKILLNSANELTSCLTQLERIQRTPIPMAYSVHLHQCIWLYILFLPYQVVAKIGWFTIPGMGLACIYLFGILAIGGEIENPFGYDDNDLPLDDYCDVVREEVERLIRVPFPAPESWIFSPKNRPFHPDCSSSVSHLQDLSFTKFQEDIMNMYMNNNTSSGRDSDGDKGRCGQEDNGNGPNKDIQESQQGNVNVAFEEEESDPGMTSVIL